MKENQILSIPVMPSRRFGRTEIQMPILSLGGMRFQQSWNELRPEEITVASQEVLECTLSKATECGFKHIETARHYGSSELQLGWAFKALPDTQRLIQTKVPPRDDPQEFESELELSFKQLGCQKVDLLAIHGLNLPVHLEQTIRPGGCLEVVRRWQEKGQVGHVGFSTHASTELIVKAIKTNEFDYVNLHWYFIRQDNEAALDAAFQFDLGVFIISPTDKGGHLHTPSPKLLDLCAPLHPIVFNDLFCLRDPRVHTISVGASRPEDLDLHLKAIEMLERSDEYVAGIEEKLLNEACTILGESWLSTWQVGLPNWDETPGHINIPVLLWLHNLLEAWDMEGYAKCRYGLLGNASHWFPGENADALDIKISEEALKKVLFKSPWRDQIPDLLRKLRRRIGGKSSQQRLSIT